MATETSPQVVDTRVLGRPPTLSQDEEYVDWSYVMRSYLCCVNAGYRKALDDVEAMSEARAQNPSYE